MSFANKERFRRTAAPYIKPLYSIDYHDEKQLLQWLNRADDVLTQYFNPLFREQKRNLKIFLASDIPESFFNPIAGLYLNRGIMEDDYYDEIRINEMFLLVQEQMSTIVSNELTAQVLPNNDDYNDKVASKFVKMWLDSMSYEMKIDIQRIKWEMQKKIFGESYVIPVWNPDKGEIHPMAKDLEEDEFELLDDTGRKVKDESGQFVKVKKWQRIGDIELKNPLPFDVMIDPKKEWNHADWFYFSEFVETEYLQKKFESGKFKLNKNLSVYNPNYDIHQSAENFTKISYFYHRSHEFLNEGRYIVFTDDAILINESLEDHPTLIDNGTLPLVRFTDLDLGLSVRGTPVLFRNALPVVDGYNSITNQISDNLHAETPKLMAHETAGINAERMPDGVVVMEWRGSIKPSIETPSTNTSSIFKFREDLKRNIIEAGQQTPMQRGDTPNAQLDSFIALQHFEDLRVQQAAPDIKKHLSSMEDLYRLMIAIAKDHYDPDDQRLIKIVGRNNTVTLKYFDPENLQKVYDVKITTTGNLANSKAARTQLIMTIKREWPEVMSNEIFVDMLGLTSTEKFQNAITAAVNSAEAENEDMLNGIDVPSPERYEDLIVHWDTHRIPLQTQEFKLAPRNVKEIMERHVTATEKLMFEQAIEDPTFRSRLLTLRQFPLFYSPEPLNDIGGQAGGQQQSETAPPVPQPPPGQEAGQAPEQGQAPQNIIPFQDRENSQSIAEPAQTTPGVQV